MLNPLVLSRGGYLKTFFLIFLTARVLSGCDSSPQNNDSIEVSIPTELRISRAVDIDNVYALVSINGLQSQRFDINDSTVVAVAGIKNNQVNTITVVWFETFLNRPLELARQTGQFNPSQETGPVNIDFAYDYSANDDNDDATNWDEREAGTCPILDESDCDRLAGELYDANLAMIKGSSARNTIHDNSLYKNIPSDELVMEDHFGPRSDYLGDQNFTVAGSFEFAFPHINGGQFGTNCEFSHFAYDDPLVYPNRPGAAHLHMFFGNTDVNAFSTYDSLINSGSGTCNGQELNRSGYWAPAMFDGNGNVRIPERVVVYYKGEGLARGSSQVYPPGAAIIPDRDINTIPTTQGGAAGSKYSFECTDQYSTPGGATGNTIPDCSGDSSDNRRIVLDMNVKFHQCWNGQDPSNPKNFYVPLTGDWYSSNCGTDVTLPNLEYFINYPVEPGENTSSWYLASDVNPETYERTVARGSTTHADWWGGWHKETNQLWIDNCVNYKTDVDSGCGSGYLSDGGPDSGNPKAGPALKLRPQYTGPSKVRAQLLFNELCETSRTYTKEQDAAYCNPIMHQNP